MLDPEEQRSILYRLAIKHQKKVDDLDGFQRNLAYFLALFHSKNFYLYCMKNGIPCGKGWDKTIEIFVGKVDEYKRFASKDLYTKEQKEATIVHGCKMDSWVEELKEMFENKPNN